MSRFADPSLTRLIVIGECQCPGTPHARDEATVYQELGYSAEGQIATAAALSGDFVTAGQRKLIELATASWNLLGPDGDMWPPTETNIALLDKATVLSIADQLAGLLPADPLPNDSGAPSLDGSPGNASQTPEITTPPSSTTS